MIKKFTYTALSLLLTTLSLLGAQEQEEKKLIDQQTNSSLVTLPREIFNIVCSNLDQTNTNTLLQTCHKLRNRFWLPQEGKEQGDYDNAYNALAAFRVHIYDENQFFILSRTLAQTLDSKGRPRIRVESLLIDYNVQNKFNVLSNPDYLLKPLFQNRYTGEDSIRRFWALAGDREAFFTCYQIMSVDENRFIQSHNHNNGGWNHNNDSWDLETFCRTSAFLGHQGALEELYNHAALLEDQEKATFWKTLLKAEKGDKQALESIPDIMKKVDTDNKLKDALFSLPNISYHIFYDYWMIQAAKSQETAQFSYQLFCKYDGQYNESKKNLYHAGAKEQPRLEKEMESALRKAKWWFQNTFKKDPTLLNESDLNFLINFLPDNYQHKTMLGKIVEYANKEPAYRSSILKNLALDHFDAWMHTSLKARAEAITEVCFNLEVPFFKSSKDTTFSYDETLQSKRPVPPQAWFEKDKGNNLVDEYRSIRNDYYKDMEFFKQPISSHAKAYAYDISSNFGDHWYRNNDSQEAQSRYEAMANGGNIQAMIDLSDFHKQKDWRENKKKANLWYQRAHAENGTLEAMESLAQLLKEERDSDSVTEAANWYEKIIKQSPIARIDIMDTLGAMPYPRSTYWKARIKVDLDQDVPSMAELAQYYWEGKIVDPNHPEAFKLAKDAANKENPKAMEILKALYADGLGCERSETLSLYWGNRYKATQGDIEAIHEIGNYYLNHDLPQAKIWYYQAADGGYIPAVQKLREIETQEAVTPEQKNIAQVYWNTRVSIANGMTSYMDRQNNKISVQNHPQACYSLGLLCERGSLGEARKSEALRWYAEAAKGKPEHKEAQERYTKLAKNRAPAP